MPIIGFEVRIDVTKIDKSRIYEGQKGKYLTLTAFIDTTEPDEYGNHGPISQATSKEERAGGLKLPILGNVKVFFEKARTADNDDSHGQAQPAQVQPKQPDQTQQQPAPAQTQAAAPPVDDPIDDIPF